MIIVSTTLSRRHRVEKEARIGFLGDPKVSNSTALWWLGNVSPMGSSMRSFVLVWAALFCPGPWEVCNGLLHSSGICREILFAFRSENQRSYSRLMVGRLFLHAHEDVPLTGTTWEFSLNSASLRARVFSNQAEWLSETGYRWTLQVLPTRDDL